MSWGRGRGWHQDRHRGIRWHIKWLGTLPGFEVSPNWFSQASRKSLVGSAAVHLLIMEQQVGACLHEGILHEIQLGCGWGL